MVSFPFELFLSAFISLFVIVDPFGTAAIFLSLAGKASADLQRRIAIKASLIAVFILLIFCLIGQFLLHYMHVSMPAFRVAGGLMLFFTAFRMVMGFHDPDNQESEAAAVKKIEQLAVFPLAIPLLAGPGVMTAALMFTTQAQTISEHMFVMVIIVIVQVIACLSLIYAGVLGRIFGETGNGIIARVMGILLAAMAVQFVADGIQGLIQF